MLNVKSAALYYAKHCIFENVNFTLNQGKWLAIMGKSGVGKTSLLRLIAGLTTLRPEKETQVCGEVTWQGDKKFDVAYMAQQDGLFPWLSVLDNVLLPFHLAGKKSDAAMAAALLQSMKLAQYRHTKPRKLSGGMRQRVALARTMIQQTPLVLMDEPFSALDAMTRLQMQALSFKLLREAQKTVVMVTHDPWEALRLADTILILEGSPARIAAEIILPESEEIRDITHPDIIKYYQDIMQHFAIEELL